MTRSPAVPLPPPNERRRLREARALTRAQLARRLGVRPDTVRAWESGRSTPRGRSRVAYAEVLSALAADTPDQVPQAQGGVTVRTAPVECAGDAAAQDPAEFVLTSTALLSPPGADTSSERGSSSATAPGAGVRRASEPTAETGSAGEPQSAHGPTPDAGRAPGHGQESEDRTELDSEPASEGGPKPESGPEPGNGPGTEGGPATGDGRASGNGTASDESGHATASEREATPAGDPGPGGGTETGHGSAPEREAAPTSDPESGSRDESARGASPEREATPAGDRRSGSGAAPEREAVSAGSPASGHGESSSSGGLSTRGRADRGGGRRRPRPSWARVLRPSGRERASGAVPAARGAGTYLTPAQAFDALYAYCAPALVRQAYLLTGRRDLAHESVERAFQRAWDHWPQVARDPDPAGWVRAAAHDWALSPWHRLRRRHRRPEPPPPEEDDRALLDALLSLAPPYRRTLVLYDGVGLDLPETAAETEASTRATAGRLMFAREVIANRLPELADPGELHDRLAELASTGRTRAAEPAAVRGGSERRARLWTRTAAAVTVVLIGSTAMTLHTAPTHYVPPVPPGETVRGVPPRVAPGPLSDEQRELRDRLRKALLDGPERLSPQAR